MAVTCNTQLLEYEHRSTSTCVVNMWLARIADIPTTSLWTAIIPTTARFVWSSVVLAMCRRITAGVCVWPEQVVPAASDLRQDQDSSSNDRFALAWTLNASYSYGKRCVYCNSHCNPTWRKTTVWICREWHLLNIMLRMALYIKWHW